MKKWTLDNTPIRDRVIDGQRERFCKKHQGWWPLEKFVRHPRGRLGYLGHCNACRTDSRVYPPPKSRGPRKARPRAKPLRLGSFKCLKCSIEKPLESFPINRGIARGHGSYCRDCDNELRRANAARKTAA